MNKLEAKDALKKISCVKIKIKELQDELDNLEKNFIKYTFTDDTDRSNYDFLNRARAMNSILSRLSEGKTVYDICDEFAPVFGSHWRAYDAIVLDCRQERAKKAYAKAYLIRALADNGFNNSQIAKIAGYTPQRCGQILKKAI